jgi:hypothetical protein
MIDYQEIDMKEDEKNIYKMAKAERENEGHYTS